MTKKVPSIIPIILSGGSGTRLWPKSRTSFPKQLHVLYGNQTMLQNTVARVAHLSSPIVVCNESQRFMVADQLSQVCSSVPDIILEPVGRNTAPAIAVAALQAKKRDPEAIVVVLPADHMIQDIDAFHRALDAALMSANQKQLVTFGIVPTSAETGYGYIKVIERQALDHSAQCSVIESFIEKPALDLAREYIKSERYLWNSGMFVFQAEAYLKELMHFEPKLVECCSRALTLAKRDLDFIRLEAEAFTQCRNISIDYAVMEKTQGALCVPLAVGWSDLGDWKSLWASLEKDENQNAIKGDVIAYNSKDCLFYGDKRLIVGVGIENIVVVDTEDALLVMDKHCTQDITHIVNQLKSSNRAELNSHRKVYRPWGYYDVIDTGEQYQVKRIEVKVGASLSLQLHRHRAEHWIVVNGSALVQKGEKSITVNENQSIYIPLGEKHRLTNSGETPLQLIEVQSGHYLDEDDIIRFDDIFGRVLAE